MNHTGEMPSDPLAPAQWNLQGWMAAYHEALRRGQPPPTSPRPVQSMKEETPMEAMQGGWQFEGKEKPVLIRICPKCQGAPKGDPQEAIDKSKWCEPCQEGKPGPGSPPTRATAPKDKFDFKNSAFFGS